MKPFLKFQTFLMLITAFLIVSCSDDNDDMVMNPDPGDPEDMPVTVRKSTNYDLNAVAVANISGKATFIEYSDNTVAIELELSNTPAGGQHPAHIHLNTAAEGGDIALTLEAVDGSTGKSSTTVTTLNDGTAISYDDLIAFDGYINVHLSAEDLATIVGQGDIGQNALTGVSSSYDLTEKAVPGINGNITFFERQNGEALSVIELINTPEGGIHPAHIHIGNALEGGGIAVSLSPVDGTTGMSKTNITQFDDGASLSYAELMDFSGYVNVHLSAEELATIVAQGDIGGSALSGVEKMYMMGEKDVAGISGMIHFYKRNNEETLAKLELMNTPANGIHPAHIHFNSAVEGGGIAISLTPVDGTTGMSYSNISMLDDGTDIKYDGLMDFDGYINVHLSPENLAVIVVQGDIGQNELTGMTIAYDLNEKDVPGISGSATFYERKSGEALAVLELVNTPAGGSHPAHIHNNSAAVGGGIAFSFNPVNGDTGMSMTHVAELDDGSSFGYNDIDTFDGYINVHLSIDNLATIVAQGNIGSNLNDDGGGDGNSGESYNVTNSGSSAYIFNGGSFTNESNADITLKRGETYEFIVNAPGHPFLIKTASSLGGGDTFDDGVSNNGEEKGTITFTVPDNAPDLLYYICEFHSSMSGTFTIMD